MRAVEMTRLGFADALVFAIFQDAEQFGLEIERRSPISSRNSVPLAGILEIAGLAVSRR